MWDVDGTGEKLSSLLTEPSHCSILDHPHVVMIQWVWNNFQTCDNLDVGIHTQSR